MEITKELATQAIFSAIDELNAPLDPELHLEKSENTILFGKGGSIDSVGLVNLVMATEQFLYDASGREILLASEEAMSRRRSPYRSVAALAEYAVEVAKTHAVECGAS